MHDNICLITGATSGIGLVTARALAQQGATVVIVARHPERGKAAVAQLVRETGNTHLQCLFADLSDQAQIHQLVDSFRQRFERLDVLVNNAGALFMQRQLSADRIEMTLALNHLGYFVLTTRLLDILQASAPARIVNVASGAHTRGVMRFDDLQGQQHYGGWRAYCQSKLANLLFTYELARRLEGTGVTVNALHPGFVATRFGHNNRGVAAWFMRMAQCLALSPEQGAETLIYLAASPEAAGVSGAYFVNKRAVKSSRASYDQNAAQRLWQLSTELTRQAPGP